MCTVLKVHPSGYYKWLKQPISNLEIKNQQILQEIKKHIKNQMEYMDIEIFIKIWVEDRSEFCVN